MQMPVLAGVVVKVMRAARKERGGLPRKIAVPEQPSGCLVVDNLRSRCSSCHQVAGGQKVCRRKGAASG